MLTRKNSQVPMAILSSKEERQLDKSGATQRLKEIITPVISFRRAGGWLRSTLEASIDAAKTNFDKVKAAWASEDIFYGGRSKFDVNASDPVALKAIALKENSILEIVNDNSLESLEQRLRSITALERISDNLDISKNLQTFLYFGESSDSIVKNIEDQPWKIQLKFQKFFAVKSILCISKNINRNHYNNENFHLPIFDEKDIRKEYLRQQINLLFAEAAETVCETQEDFEKFVQSTIPVSKEASQKNLELPEIAPELYKNRLDRKEKPVDFIKRVYENWLGKGLLRPDIKKLDKSLYEALYKREIPQEFEILLPKAQGRSGDQIYRTAKERVTALKESQKRADAKRRPRSLPN